MQQCLIFTAGQLVYFAPRKNHVNPYSLPLKGEQCYATALEDQNPPAEHQLQAGLMFERANLDQTS